MTQLPSEATSKEVLDLTGRKGLVVGIANQHSLAWSAAEHFRNAGAELAITYPNDRARPFVAPLAQELSASLFASCDVSRPGNLEDVFEALRKRWGGRGLVFHLIAGAR